jgi:hypothetical protein
MNAAASPALKFRIVDAQLQLTDCRTRLPFRFGVHTLISAPFATLRIEIETLDGRREFGASSDLLVPKWFEKDLEKTPERDSRNLADSAEKAMAFSTQQGSATVFDHWLSCYESRVGGQSSLASDLLLRGFGVALMERALMDAVCRREDCSFHEALLGDLFGFQPGRVHGALQGWNLSESLPAKPATSMNLRHTIGLLDALTPEDWADAEAPQDGFPTCLAEDIARYGLSWFKIKINGEKATDVKRLLAIAEVLQACGVKNPRFTLDGNEQFSSMDDLADTLEEVVTHPQGAEILQGLAFIEQPLSRKDTFRPELHAGLSRVRVFGPVIIDEADFGVQAFPEAVALGYEGVSIKACKGVFRALLNRGLCEISSGNLFQSGEDLTNLPVRALQQDLCLMASLGIEHVERNGHHYFKGLHHLSSAEREQALLHHPDLYVSGKGGAELSIKNGKLSLSSLQAPGFGCGLKP